MSGARPRLMRNAMRLSAIALLLLATVAVRVVSSAAQELQRGDACAANGELDAAVVHYRRAARWYAPGSPYSSRALGRLGSLGAAAERRGDSELALSAYRAIRAAVMSTRSWYVPERERLAAADERIASLMAVQPPPPMDAGKSVQQLRGEHLALLQAETGPRLGWTLVLLLGFFGWVAGAFALSLRAVDADNRIVARELRRWGALVVVGFALFVLGMSLA